MGFYGEFNGIHGTYPLVMTNEKLRKITMLLMGKSTISMAIFNSYVKLPEGNIYAQTLAVVLHLHVFLW